MDSGPEPPVGSSRPKAHPGMTVRDRGDARDATWVQSIAASGARHSACIFHPLLKGSANGTRHGEAPFATAPSSLVGGAKLGCFADAKKKKWTKVKHSSKRTYAFGPSPRSICPV